MSRTVTTLLDPPLRRAEPSFYNEVYPSQAALGRRSQA